MENNNKTTISKPFKYKTKIIGRKPVYNNRLNTEVVIPLKYLSIFFLFKIKLDLTWSNYPIISQISRTAGVAANPPNPASEPTEITSATFQITSVELYVLVVTLSYTITLTFRKHKARIQKGNSLE